MIQFLYNEDTPLPDPAEHTDDVVAIGGKLSVDRLLEAYQKGIFPWFNEDEPILWWCPVERMILYPENLRVTKSMQQVLKKDLFQITVDIAFTEVINSCSKIKRKGQDDTWITDAMIEAYIKLHKAGYAHSVEVWQDQKLVGGLYGIALGKCFFGESMFSKVSNASKAGFIFLVKNLQKHDFKLIDCQVYTEHLESLGAKLVPKEVFLDQLKEGLKGNSPTTFNI